MGGTKPRCDLFIKVPLVLGVGEHLPGNPEGNPGPVCSLNSEVNSFFGADPSESGCIFAGIFNRLQKQLAWNAILDGIGQQIA